MIAKFREEKDLYARCDYLEVAKLPAFETRPATLVLLTVFIAQRLT